MEGKSEEASNDGGSVVVSKWKHLSTNIKAPPMVGRLGGVAMLG